MAEHMARRNSFTRALAENENIAEQFRKLMHDTLDGMYLALGKKNFLRWINERKISEKIKLMIVEEFTEEEMKKYPYCAGFFIPRTNIEKLRPGYINEDVARHETNHFFTDFWMTNGKFPTFIAEGLTEFLSFEMANTIGKEKTSYSYPQNVDFVKFLHDMIGDSLIKAYYTGRVQEFEDEFSTYITDDGRMNETALKEFYSFLNRVHGVLNPRGEAKTEEEKEHAKSEKAFVEENVYPKLRQIMCNILSNTIRKKAHDLEYYEDGELNIGIAVSDINKLTEQMMQTLAKHRTFGISLFYDKENLELRENIMRNALAAVLQESHIPNEKINDILTNSIVKGFTRVEGNRAFGAYPIIAEDILRDSINALDINDQVKDLIDKRLGNTAEYVRTGKLNATVFLMDVSVVLDKMGLSSEQRQLYLDSAILRYLPQEINRDLVTTMIDKYSKLYVALYRKQEENKRNVVESRFVKVSDTKFIEVRDNKLFFLTYDEKNGTFLERQIIKDYDSIRVASKNGEFLTRVTYYDRDTKSGTTCSYALIYDEDFSNVTLNKKKRAVMFSPEELAEGFLVDEAMRKVLEGINEGKYTFVLNDGEELDEFAIYTGGASDTNSRVINYKLFIKELKDSIASVPKEMQQEVERNTIYKLITKTYLTSPGDIAELQEYISRISLDNISSDAVVEKLYGFTQTLNEARRKAVEEPKQYTLIFFESEDDRKRWVEKQEKKEARRRREELRRDTRGFIAVESMSCITEPLEVRTEREHYSTVEGVIYDLAQRKVAYRTPSARKVDYNKFCEMLKEKLTTVDEKNRDKYLNWIIEGSINAWYGNGEGYPEADEINEKRWDLYDNLIQVLREKILEDKEIDVARVEEIERQILELSEDEEKHCLDVLDKRKPIGFEYDTAKITYETVRTIHESQAIPEEAKEQIIEGAKDNGRKYIFARRGIKSFARLALSGENTPSDADIKRASKFMEYASKGITEISDD